MEVDEATVLHQIQRVLKHRLSFGGKTSDQIGAQCSIWPESMQALCHRHGFRTTMATLHSLENHVVA